MNKIKKEYKLIIPIIILVLIDQLLKFVILKVGNPIYQNTSGTYGVDSNSTFTYIVTNLIVVLIAFKFATSQNQFVDKKIKVFLILIISGGVSNTIDRIFRGFVVEFIKIGKLPVFNLADIFILIGWVSMAGIFAVFTTNEIKERKIEKQNKNKKGMNNLQKIKVEETGKRIDAFLTSKIDASRVTVQRLIDEEKNFSKW